MAAAGPELCIEAYRFGRMVVAGCPHHRDLWIAGGAVHGDWRRRRGHELHPEDLVGLLAADPRLLVVGTGALGRMRVLPETRELLAGRGVELLALPTGRAVVPWNEHAGDPAAAGAFHLTC